MNLKNKILIIGGAVLILASSIYISCNLSSKLQEARADLEAAQVTNSIVEAEKHRLDSLAVVYKKQINERDSIIVVRDKRINKQCAEIAVLTDSIKNNLEEVATVTADSSYSYINLRVKPTAELKYRFDSIQVKNIHYNYVERDGLKLLIDKIQVTFEDLRQLSSIKDNQIAELKLLNNVYISKEAILRKENESYQIEIKGLGKALKQQKFLKTLSNCVVIGLTGYIVVDTIVK